VRSPDGATRATLSSTWAVANVPRARRPLMNEPIRVPQVGFTEGSSAAACYTIHSISGRITIRSSCVLSIGELHFHLLHDLCQVVYSLEEVKPH
jgi:hypothetical protein